MITEEDNEKEAKRILHQKTMDFIVFGEEIWNSEEIKIVNEYFLKILKEGDDKVNNYLSGKNPVLFSELTEDMLKEKIKELK